MPKSPNYRALMQKAGRQQINVWLTKAGAKSLVTLKQYNPSVSTTDIINVALKHMVTTTINTKEKS